MRDCSTHELGAELAQTSADVCGAEARERAAEARHLSERTPEAEIAYEVRCRETIRVREPYARLSEELVWRGAAAAGPEDRAGSEEAGG